MYCKKCGKQIDDDALFCSYCGTKMTQTDTLNEELQRQQSHEAWKAQMSQRLGHSAPEAKKAPTQAAPRPQPKPVYEAVSPSPGTSSAVKAKKPIYKRWWFWLIVVLVFFIVLPGGSDEPEIVNNGGENSVVKDDTSPTYITIGQTADWDDIRVTFNSVTQNNGSEWFAPSQGNVFVVCEFTIENNTNYELNISSIMCFDAYVDDYSTSLSITAESSVEKETLDGTIAPGKKMKGIIGYEVPSDWETLEIHFTPGFWSGKDFIFSADNS